MAAANNSHGTFVPIDVYHFIHKAMGHPLSASLTWLQTRSAPEAAAADAQVVSDKMPDAAGGGVSGSGPATNVR
jgi:hypothetical protein